jgi:heat shock protein HtpX
MSDYIKTIFLLGILSVFIILIGSFFGGRQGLWIAFIFSLLLNGVAYFFSDKIALKSSRAKPLDKSQHSRIYQMVEDLSRNLKIPVPKLYIIPSRQANAFATGRNPKNASVAVTEGILDILTEEELKGVLAHELGHVKNRDILIATVAAVLASSLAFISRIGLYSGSGDRRGGGGLALILAILAPFAGLLIQSAISREREYEADETGAKTIGRGDTLARALRKIHDSAKRSPMNINPAFSSLYISNPLGAGNLTSLFSTHPPVEKRVERLRKL